jgi:hypothetical protein
VIRQLRRLTRTVPAAGAGACALAVYAEACDGAFAQRAAAEQGFEGVACVDDAARAAVLYCQIWRQQRLPWALADAEALLRFVTFMQQPDGRFVNFILDWDGEKNLTGPSSRPAGWAWQARAMHALALGVATFGKRDWDQHFRAGLPWLDRPMPYLDVQAVCVLAALEYFTATGAADLAERALAWAENIARNRAVDSAGDVLPILPDAPGRSDVHLWGHLQEAALAQAGRVFDRADLVAAARASADALLLPAVARAFAAPRTLAFDVSCAVLSLTAVAEATHETLYAEQADLARAWFDGRNAAARPLYDRDRGLVHDGLDHERVNQNSGAESNIEAALALLDSLPWERYSGRRASVGPSAIQEVDGPEAIHSSSSTPRRRG